ncbi:MAG: TIGR03758 family integrating conjugative element protein [Verrucomicrobia bacterium]|nr:TIGR03758 family integrating conjugative element protein [Verrucomicrobiota bacterium]
MNQKRDLAPLFPALIGLVLLGWGFWVTYTAITCGDLPVVGWHTEAKELFGLTWLIVFVVVLLPAYLYAIGLGWQSLRNPVPASERPKRYWLAAFGVSVMLCALTFCARVAATAWFPSPMHPPFAELRGGWVSGLAATIILLLLEAGVLAGIKHQTRRGQHLYPLLIPGGFALVLLVWAGWVAYTAFTDGSLPIVGWQTERRLLFGLLWLAVFCVVLLPTYLYAVSLGLLSLIGKMDQAEKLSQNFWLVAISNTALLCLITFCARLAVTAWFPEQMHPPLHQFNGGILAGLLATAALGLVVAVYYRIARSF